MGIEQVTLDLAPSHGWYDCSVLIGGHKGFEERFAGKVETGAEGKTDPLMGGMV